MGPPVVFLIAVIIVVFCLRFKVYEEMADLMYDLVGDILHLHGTKTLFNGQPNRMSYPDKLNRAARRRARALKRGMH